MEALSAGQDDNPSSVKSDDSSPRRDSGAGSPPPNCAICLGTCKNKSFTDSCLHQFCFSCLLTWSKVKAECPLCKQAFRSIIHNVRSNHQYEEYLVVQRQTEESSSRIDIDRVTAATQRFRYRTTLTLPRRETYAIQELLRHYPFMADVFGHDGVVTRPPVTRRRRSPASFRRTVYRHNLWARPLPDFTGRFRDCSPEFYRYNDTQMHRLVPWLNRELHYLLNENVGHISYVMTRILDLLSQHHINSSEFREQMQRYFGDRTEHFLHELYCFASTPYDMTGYDRNVQYTTDTRISMMVNEVISSSDSEASVDSDIVIVTSSGPTEPPPGPSRVPPPVYPAAGIAQPPAQGVIPIETFSDSDTDDDSSEVMVVGYIKPPQERTPEIVDLLGSDSDVIVQESSPPSPAPAPRVEPEPRAAPAVKLTLKRQRAPSGSSGRAESVWRATPERFPAWRPPSSSSSTTTTSSSISTSSDSPSPSPTSTESDVDSSPVPVKRKKKSKKRSPSARKEKRSKKRSSRSHHRDRKTSAEKDRRGKRKSHSGKGVKSSKRNPERAAEVEAQAGPSSASAAPSTSSMDSAGTSAAGKAASGAREAASGAREAASGAREAASGAREAASGAREAASGAREAASGAREAASGAREAASGAREAASGAREAASGAREAAGATLSEKEVRRRAKERKRRRRDSRESKRLRSVVNVMYHRNAEESNSSVNCSFPNVSTAVNEPDSRVAADPGDSPRERLRSPPHSPDASHSRTHYKYDGSTDSEDNLPLNLTLHKMNLPT